MTPWLTLSEFLAASSYSRATFFRRRAQIESRKIDDVLMFSAASLPAEARPKLLEAQGHPPDVPLSPVVSQVEAPVFPSLAASARPLQAPTPRVALDPAALSLAKERLAIIQPLLDYVSDKPCRASFARLTLADGRPIVNSNLLAEYLCETRTCRGKKVSRATLWTWKKAYTTSGLHGLARTLRSDKGKSRFFNRHPRAAALVASAYLKPYETVQTAYDLLIRDRELLGLSLDEVPDYCTVRRYLESIPKPFTVLAREGERSHAERMNQYLQRGYEDVAANQIWVSDHMIHDCFVWNDCFPSEPEGKMMRLRLTMILDMRSRKPVGYSWTPEGSSNSIKSALRRAVQAYGPCELFYCDHGKDFKKVARGSSSLAISDAEATLIGQEIAEIDRHGILTRLGIPTQHCLKYHPQSKHIERFFRTLHLQFDAKFAAYTTGNAYLRPDAANVLAFEHRRLQKVGLHSDSKLLPASVFIAMAAMWLEESYSNAPHRGKGMEGLSPNQIFEAGYPVGSRRHIDPLRLDELLYESKTVRVRETAVTLHKRRYMAVDPLSSSQLYLANEQQVRIHYDPNDLDRAVITDLSGVKIASVQAERLTSHSAAAQPHIAASMQERKRLRNATADTLRTLRRNVQQMGHQNPMQDMYDRAMLPAGVSELITQRAPQTVQAEITEAIKQIHSEDIGDALASRLSRRNNGTLG